MDKKKGPMAPFVEKLVDKAGVRVFGMTLTEALRRECCIRCKRRLDLCTEFAGPIQAERYKVMALCRACQEWHYDGGPDPLKPGGDAA